MFTVNMNRNNSQNEVMQSDIKVSKINVSGQPELTGQFGML